MKKTQELANQVIPHTAVLHHSGITNHDAGIVFAEFVWILKVEHFYHPSLSVEFFVAVFDH